MVSGLFSLLRTPLWRPFRRLRKDARGVSAVEFALIVPIMFTLYFGCNELGTALTVLRKVTHATSTLGDLVAQAKTVSSNDMNHIMEAVDAITMPYSDVHLRARVSLVTIDNNGQAKVVWSSASNFGATTGTAKEPLIAALVANAPVTLPAGVVQNNTYLVFAEVHSYYTPAVGYIMTGTFDLKDTFYLRPRFGTSITGPS